MNKNVCACAKVPSKRRETFECRVLLGMDIPRLYPQGRKVNCVKGDFVKIEKCKNLLNMCFGELCS